MAPENTIDAPGSYSQAAIERLFTRHSAFTGRVFSTRSYPSEEKLQQAILDGELELGLIAIENSHTGTLHTTLTMLVDGRLSPVRAGLANAPRVHVVGEYIHAEPHRLLAPPGATLEGIEEVRSHPHVLEQCSRWLDDHVPRARRVAELGTGWASKAINELGDPSIAAIAGEKALEHYDNLIELAQGIETYPSATFTRFWLLGLEPAKGERHHEPRTSLAIRTKNRPGALFRVLACFALRDINVCTIECRPHVRGAVEAHSPWDYTMYLDVDGVPDLDPGVCEAIMNLREFADDVILLGSYPRYTLEVMNGTWTST
ncbi:Prephenate dehydratase-domain-containing protein [Piptocephalis cylindrospora]|uniref:prephenate dehydratase n=1 Tax=Piptocephalis cylindrospora TaxID=1907219 RepID=A0A4P9Y049_9FUNG|nr:Prephenate dehydratase-domain-containing protein [Piptocephalis cylindrospora]|eukprot:RKP12148.1 Prephenate dehydratase-domain-containing protein [Piptocephalis cylindrospora]